MFQIQTRYGNSPINKNKILFLSTEEDYQKYRESISAMLVETENINIAVYCKTSADDTVTPEEWDTLLQQIRLAVFPVSADLFSDEQLLSEELPWLMAHNIPLLPLMTEPSLDEPFYQAFGTIQYLALFEQGDAEVSLQNKLTNLLSHLLADDDETKKIQSVFRRSVFISYRKKDRIHIQELLKALHTEPALQRVSVWYDEYLTPGENFSNEIVAYMDKCDVFLLLVTPHLLEKDNYVLREEYPYAVRIGKPILAVMAEPVPFAQFEAVFPGVPLLTDIGALPENALIQSLGDTAFANVGTRYLTALAYLKGITVETNTPLALSLLESGVNEGSIDCYYQLIDVFRFGIGVPHSKEKVIAYYRELCERLEQDYRKRGIPDTAEFLRDACDKFYLYCEEEKEYRLAYRVAAKLAWVTEQQQHLATPEQRLFFRINHAMALCFAADMALKMQSSEAEIINLYFRARNKADKVFEDALDARAPRETVGYIQETYLLIIDHAVNAFLLLGHPEATEVLLKDKQTISQLQLRNSPETARNKVLALVQQAKVHIDKGNYREAMETYIAALEENDKLILNGDDNTSLQAITDRAAILLELSAFYIELQDFVTAANTLRMARPCIDEVLKRNDTSVIRSLDELYKTLKNMLPQ